MNNSEVVKSVERRVRATIKTLPTVVGNEVVNFSLEAFRKQGWLGDSFQPWPKRKKISKWGITPRNNGRATLVDTGKLRRATRIISADWHTVKVGNSIPYAAAHNNGVRLGLIQTVRAHRRKVASRNGVGAIGGKLNKAGTAQRVKFGQTSSGVSFVTSHKRKINQHIPKRQFLGNSPYLTRNIHRAIALKINKAINS